jgi:hypothetical protein
MIRSSLSAAQLLRVLGILMSFVLWTSCASYQAQYSLPLAKVISVPSAHLPFLRTDKTISQEVEVNLQPDQQYENSILRMNWWLSPKALSFSLTNISSDTLFIDWSHAQYVDEHGQKYGVIRQDVHPRYAGGDKRVSVIPPKGRLFEQCYPSKCFVQYGRSYSLHSLFPLGAFNKEVLSNELHNLVGKELELWLPIDSKQGSFTYLLCELRVKNQKSGQ